MAEPPQRKCVIPPSPRPLPRPEVHGEATYHMCIDRDNGGELSWVLEGLFLKLPSVDGTYEQLVRIPNACLPKTLASKFGVNSECQRATLREIGSVHLTDKALHIPVLCNFELYTAPKNT